MGESRLRHAAAALSCDRHHLANTVNLRWEDEDIVVWKKADCRNRGTRLAVFVEVIQHFSEAGGMAEGKACPTVDDPIGGFMEDGMKLLVRPTSGRFDIHFIVSSRRTVCADR